MTDDAPAEPAPVPAPAPAPAKPAGRRALVLGIAAAALAMVVITVVIATRVPVAGARSGAGGGTGSDGFTGARSGVPTLPRAGTPGTGSEQLAGTVVDAQGAPVDGVRVTAVLELGPGDQSRAPLAPGAEVIAYAGADGAFTLEGLERGRHRLRVDGDEIFTAEVRFVAVPSDGVRIAVARRVDVAGVVLDSGRPVPGATVTIDGDGLAGRRDTLTDADGTFLFDELPEGGYRVWAHETDLVARAVRVPRLGAGPFVPVTLTLEPGTIVVGRVVDRATRIGIEAAVSIEPAASPDEAAHHGRAAPDGVFRVEGVPHGRWLVDAWAPGWMSTGAIEIDAGRGIPEIELVAGGIIEGRVIDGKGRPVAGAVIAATGQGALGRNLEMSAEVDADRLRRFSGFTPTGGAPGVPGGAVAPVDFAADPQFITRGELGVMLGPIPFPPPPGSTGVRQAVILPDAPTAQGLGVGAPLPLAPDPAYQAQLVTDDRGRFRITGLDAATWQVIAVAPGMAEGRSGKLTLELGKIVTGTEIVLSAGTFLVGAVTGAHGAPLVGATVTAEPRDGRGDRDRVVAITDATGRYRMGPLIGDAIVTASTYGHADSRAEVSLPAPEGDLAAEVTHDFVLEAADAVMRGRVLDASRLPVQGAMLVIEGGGARGRRATTDDTGWFQIDAVPAGDGTARVEHPDFPLQRFPLGTNAEATLSLVWGGALEGVVFDHHTGAPLAGIAVSVRGPGGTLDVATGPAGELVAGPLLAGAYTLRVAVPGYVVVERTVEVPAATAGGAVTARDVRIELARGALLAGVVRDRYGKRLAGATVTVSLDAGGTVEGKTDSEGQFRFHDTPTGDVTVRAHKGALRGAAALTLRPGDEVLSFTLDLE